MFLTSGISVFVVYIAFGGCTRFSARFLSPEQFGGNLVHFLFFSGSCFLSCPIVCFLFLWLSLVLFLFVWLLSYVLLLVSLSFLAFVGVVSCLLSAVHVALPLLSCCCCFLVVVVFLLLLVVVVVVVVVVVAAVFVVVALVIVLICPRTPPQENI